MARLPAAMARPETSAFVALGANLGDAQAAVRGALQALGQRPGLRLLRASSLYRTAPFEAQGPDFINAVAEVATTLSAPELLRALQAIELAAGRERPYPNAPRTPALVPLFYGEARIQSPALTVPERAIANDQDQKLVYVVGIDDSAQPRQIQLGASVGDERVVTAGLNDGDRVVIDGLQHVTPGLKLNVQDAVAYNAVTGAR